MAVVDPFVPLRDWPNSLFRGDPAVIDRFLDAIDDEEFAWTGDRLELQSELLLDGGEDLGCRRLNRAAFACDRPESGRVTA